jgi:hypothetical protein
MSPVSARSSAWAAAFMAGLAERGEISVEAELLPLLEQRLAEAMESELYHLQRAYVKSQSALEGARKTPEYLEDELSGARREVQRLEERLKRLEQDRRELGGLVVVLEYARQLCDLLLVEPERLSPVERGLAEHVMLVLSTQGPKGGQGDGQG